jgi:hypothetical protein
MWNDCPSFLTCIFYIFCFFTPGKQPYFEISEMTTHRTTHVQWPPGRLYIGRRNESARADRRVMRKKTGASTILKEIEENRDFELFSSSGHFSQSFWC